MGKHDRTERFSRDVPDTDYLIAENRKLKAENERLNTLVKALEKDAARMDRVYDSSKDRSAEIIFEKNAEIELLKAKILRLVDAYV